MKEAAILRTMVSLIIDKNDPDMLVTNTHL